MDLQPPDCEKARFCIQATGSVATKELTQVLVCVSSLSHIACSWACLPFQTANSQKALDGSDLSLPPSLYTLSEAQTVFRAWTNTFQDKQNFGSLAL